MSKEEETVDDNKALVRRLSCQDGLDHLVVGSREHQLTAPARDEQEPPRATTDRQARGWSICGAERAQSTATGGKRTLRAFTCQ